MQKIKLIAIDLDGTLLYQNKIASQEEVKYLIDLQKKGYSVIIVTGRNYQSCYKFAKKLKINKNFNYLICENGAYVTRANKFLPDLIDFINKKDCKDLYEYFSKLEIPFFGQKCMSPKKLFCSEPSKISKKSYKYKTYIIKKSFDFSGMTFIGTHFKIDKDYETIAKEIETNFSSRLKISHSFGDNDGLIYYMFSSKNTDKGSKTLKLINSLGFENEQILYFGDGDNDASALELFENSVAMGNAQESVKQKAKYITKKCTEEGIMNFLKTNNIK
ncbi:Cof-type HAD-IIB family hydrolase [Spiroplasma gladiatoris]|uniref:Cof-type HAD-IIB family hydrolase n=1 Tax=Spiroplasma gladiatoris TaxID=2143 RepID=A0A4V1AQ80_9MOLU|nr:Cof-type HAD-IIB family hydrolase [Spiroplasma gladiatoris]QBQ07569.1 Cof-type HAD-IIB family hydrolase [Spiroplasma gladiatoris]